jgi:hypothetical protein
LCLHSSKPKGKKEREGGDINNRLLNFLDQNDIPFEKQFGFRSGHSTDHAILCIIDKIQKAI